MSIACRMCELRETEMTIISVSLSLFISDRVMVECACVCMCLVTDILCHKRNVFTYTQYKNDVCIYVCFVANLIAC